MEDKSLFVINPNSSVRVTNGIDRAIDPLRSLGVPIQCETLSEGPAGIETQAQSDLVVAPLLTLTEKLRPRASGVVIACFGDPGLHAVREKLDCPVLGIQESAILTAMTLGQRFGIISILQASVTRHLRAIGAMGVSARCAGDKALNLGVAELAHEDQTLARMAEVGAELRDKDGADTLIMGCAGMADFRTDLEHLVGLPVVEPCQAAVSMAIGRIALNQGGNERV